ncbi:AAA family ATPase [Flagellimonas sp.]|uniref:AAA family ATPase n=1 Tax=Flagellimonas sp. TaxID=2058762 RepID=UPI003C7E63A2
MKRTKDHYSFYVITGGPGTGKTTLLEELRQRGFKVVPETVHQLIKAQQAIDGDALSGKNRKRYMELMFQAYMEHFEKAIKDHNDKDVVFFDHSFLDALCYAALEGVPIDQEMKTLAETHRYHPQVFILPPWKDIYHRDAQCTQDWNEAVFTYNKMIQTYRSYRYDLIEVPRIPVKERADFVLESIHSK